MAAEFPHRMTFYDYGKMHSFFDWTTFRSFTLHKYMYVYTPTVKRPRDGTVDGRIELPVLSAADLNPNPSTSAFA